MLDMWKDSLWISFCKVVMFCSCWWGTMSVIVIVSNRLREGCMYEIYFLPGFEDSLSKFPVVDYSSPVPRSGSKFNCLPLYCSVGNWSKKISYFPLAELSRYSGLNLPTYLFQFSYRFLVEEMWTKIRQL